MKQYEMFELSFTGEEPKGSFALADVKAEFIHESGEKIKVSGFYAGEGVYKVRFYPAKAGAYTWKAAGDVSGSGQEFCDPADNRHHGMVKAVDLHFAYEDGTIYRPFGTTIYGMCHQTEELIRTTWETLKNAPFNKVRHCVFPKHYDFNNNDPQFFPFEKDENGNWDVNRPCFVFWDHLEESIFALQEMGIESDLILFHPYDCWGFAQFSMEQCEIYLRYLLARLAAVPSVWWSMANEYDLCAARSLEDWYRFEEIIREGDVYGHLLSNHNCLPLYDFTREAITHCCIQSTRMGMMGRWMQKYQKPVINDECCYEGNIDYNWGNLSGWEMVNRFWQACAQGGYATHGETFLDENDVLWWAKGGVLKGDSPKRIAFLRSILEELPGPIEPARKMGMADLAELSPEARVSMENNPFIKVLFSLPETDRELFLDKQAVYQGQIGDEVFIEYFADHCKAFGKMELPEDHRYNVEVIDVWEMTRTTVLENVSGSVEAPLPGRPGIAVLAKRRD